MNVLTAVIFSTCALGGAPSGELLDFTAKWCGPCQQMGPIVDRLHRQGYPVRKVDFDENRELARRFNISSIPAFVLVIDGKVVERSVGVQSERDLLAMLSKIPKPDPEFDPKRPDETLLVSSSRTNVIPPPAPKWIPAAPPKGILAPFFKKSTGQNSGTEVARLDQNSKQAIRGNNEIDNKPLNVDTILAREPMQASIRIRITDQAGTNVGSGTIVDSRVGNTLILTCGHIFRNFREGSLVEVDVFVNGKKDTIVGKHVRHDLKLDLGMISIATDNPLPFARVASGDYQVEKGAAVVSVGCGQGNEPTRQKHMVTQINRYQGPSNIIECTGVPIQGRSGGGLFNQAGEVVGVCMAADEQGQRGLYVGLLAIQGFLKTSGKQELLKDGLSPDVEFEAESDMVLADGRDEQPAPRGIAALQAALGEDAAGVVCVVKSGKNSLAGQRVVVLSGKRPAEPVASLSRSLSTGRIQTTTMEK